MLPNLILLVKFLILVGVVLVSYTAGWFFTTKYDLASKSSLFRFKAFECRPCLTFHFNWVISTAIGLLFGDCVMILIGVLFSFLLWSGLKIDEKEKTIKL